MAGPREEKRRHVGCRRQRSRREKEVDKGMGNFVRSREDGKDKGNAISHGSIVPRVT